MNRKFFIYQLAGLFGIGWLKPRNKSRPKKARHWLYSGWIAGVFYYEGHEVLDHLKAGSELKLRREPDNPYDGRAIEVYAGVYKLGYIPMSVNEPIAAMMDRGEQLEAEVEELSGGNWGGVKVRVELRV